MEVGRVRVIAGDLYAWKLTEFKHLTGFIMSSVQSL